jgi:phosphoserine phosphatase
MAGQLDFESALRARVRLLAGLDAAAIGRARDQVRLTPGARTFVRTLRRMGFRVAIVSGGFTPFTDWLRDELQLDHAFANELDIADGRLTGDLVGPVVDRTRKAELLAHVAELEGIPLDQTVAVGDGANDLDMLAAAGLGIAFNAKPVVREAADTALNVPYLDAVLFVLGVRRSEVEAADAADGLWPDRTDVPTG